VSQGPFHLTFDVDWAHDDVLRDVLDRLESRGCRATFFITHDSPLIHEMAGIPWVERGLHPNFNPLLFPGAAGDASVRSAAEVLERLHACAPEATSARSHSLVRGTPLLRLLAERGITLDSSDYLPLSAAPGLSAHHSWTGVRIAPFSWSDYMDVLQGAGADLFALLDSPAPLRVAAFHPIHVALNAGELADYERAKADGPDGWREHRRPAGSGGVGDQLDRLLEALQERRIETALLRDVAAIGESPAR
jgi:hypothetical protein